MADYKNTLNLPRTDFEMRAGLAKKEPLALQSWEQTDLYGRLHKARADAPRFVLHDGPPYANGHLHHGHILNKILKDMVVKDRSMAGYCAQYVPGWDCHGLPIEVQVDKELGRRKAEMSKVDVRAACREYAAKFVDIQRDEFRRLGVMGRWAEPYLTMNFKYEAAILRELARFVDNGLLYKGLRPVNWCMVHQTALAEAEVEYEDHTSPSIYVAFPVKEEIPGQPAGQHVSIVIWTTTPWTLPANQGVSLHPDFEYVLYPVGQRLCLFARGLAESFLEAVGEPGYDRGNVVARFRGRDLEGVVYEHPLFEREHRVILGDHVTMEAGTGCVHTAPGHGADDFMVGRRYGLEVLSPVDDRGVFTEEAGPYAGQKVFDANEAIVRDLVAKGLLLNRPDDRISHRYAHCWRCNKPVILRATEQWFVSLDRPYAGGASLRTRALETIPRVQWTPPWGEDRIRGMLAARPDWCLSRQRVWGVPIVVVYCEACGEPLLDGDWMREVADIFEIEGADAWFARSVSELVSGRCCGSCGHGTFRRENDILDVWFDSGVSWAAAVEREGLGHEKGPAVDLYLEGSDQHRGWFHSSLLCGLATREHAPFRAVLTHGFVVDGHGKKISKSKGNFVDPFKTIRRDGAEILRLWVAGEDYREDVRISQEILLRLSETYRKVRNTVRYLLGSLSGFDPNTDLVQAGELEELDRYALAMCASATERMRRGYAEYEFHVVVQRLNELCTVDLSAFYLDVLKDRLYASAALSPLRRSAQSAIYLITRDLLRCIAPVLCFTADEAWQHLPRLAGDPDSVHLALYPGLDEPEGVRDIAQGIAEESDRLRARYDAVREVRRRVNGVLEDARRQSNIGSSVEAWVALSGSGEELSAVSGFSENALADLFIVSRVTVVVDDSDLEIKVERAPGTKCARCWLYREDVGSTAEHPDVCCRCAEAIANG